jgi:diaminopimelate decarboxylase
MTTSTTSTAPPTFFHYRGDQLHCEDVPLERIAAEVGTPTYVYSRGALEHAYRAFDEALAGVKHVVCCSVKANGNLAVLNVLARLGAGSDIVSGGELFRVLRAGGDPKKCVFSGVGKTVDEMRQALTAGVMAFNVESAEELHVLDRVARELGVRAPVALRVNPDVDAQTHPYISTGLKNNKFGIATDDARELFRVGRGMGGVDMVGIDCHIGSQLTKTSPFADAIARLNELILALHADGAPLRYLDIGGGLGIDYEKQGDAPPPSPGEYGEIVRRALAPIAHLDLTLVCEPGRVIVGRAGVLLTRVLYRKSNEAKHFTIVDAAFNDLMRPALYSAYHPMQPVRRDEARATQVTDVVGPICESSDFLARDRSLPLLEQGELLSVGAAGAYGFAMASNYNTRPRAAEIMVRGGTYSVVRTRETLEQLLANERVVD